MCVCVGVGACVCVCDALFVMPSSLVGDGKVDCEADHYVGTVLAWCPLRCRRGHQVAGPPVVVTEFGTRDKPSNNEPVCACACACVCTVCVCVCVCVSNMDAASWPIHPRLAAGARIEQ